MAAFFLSLLPQFVPAGDGSLPGSLLLGTIFCAMTFTWLSGYALVVHRLRHALLRGPVRRGLDALAGTVLVVLRDPTGGRVASTVRVTQLRCSCWTR